MGLSLREKLGLAQKQQESKISKEIEKTVFEVLAVLIKNDINVKDTMLVFEIVKQKIQIKINETDINSLNI